MLRPTGTGTPNWACTSGRQSAQGISPGSPTWRLHAAQHGLSIQSCGEQPHGFVTGVPLVQEKGSEPSLVSPEEAGRVVDNIKN
jgi:hypothetical protein